MRRMRAVTVVLTALCAAACSGEAEHANPIERGAYLAILGGCHDCHTPKVFTDGRVELDESRLLSGHPAVDVLPEAPQAASMARFTCRVWPWRRRR